VTKCLRQAQDRANKKKKNNKIEPSKAKTSKIATELNSKIVVERDKKMKSKV
jgi:hypothetical protein